MKPQASWGWHRHFGPLECVGCVVQTIYKNSSLPWSILLQSPQASIISLDLLIANIPSRAITLFYNLPDFVHRIESSTSLFFTHRSYRPWFAFYEDFQKSNIGSLWWLFVSSVLSPWSESWAEHKQEEGKVNIISQYGATTLPKIIRIENFRSNNIKTTESLSVEEVRDVRVQYSTARPSPQLPCSVG